MKREIIQYLEEWKNRKDRNPLIVRGARQVGKTYVLEEFAKNKFLIGIFFAGIYFPGKFSIGYIF